MFERLFRAGVVVSLIALSACTEATFEDIVPPQAHSKLPPAVLKTMREKGMAVDAPIMVRSFKEEGVMEVWKQRQNGRYDLVTSYNICKWSGKLGPKFVEGDRQAPEGFYSIKPHQMNPRSKYHLAFNIGYPNAYDRAHGRSGSNLMVHGGCSSAGCYSLTDEQVEEVYAFARDAFAGGQTEFQYQAYPFRMTPQNMARYRNDPNYAFWKMLKEGYDHFEITKVPPKVDVCEKRYVFNLVAEGEATFEPTRACPPTTQPQALMSAFASYQSSYEAAFSTASARPGGTAPRASIAGVQEAHVVADWTRKRARGERVPLEPPALGSNGEVVHTTTRMGRIDSPEGRRMAALEAAEAEKKRLAEEKAEAARRTEQERAAAKAAAEAEKAAAEAAAEAAKNKPVEAVAQEAPAAEEKEPGMLDRARRRITNLFGS